MIIDDRAQFNPTQNWIFVYFDSKRKMLENSVINFYFSMKCTVKSDGDSKQRHLNNRYFHRKQPKI